MMKYLQRIGRSLMLPVAVLPAAAILLGIGYSIDPVGWGANSPLAAFLIKAGGSILDNMAILFAIGVALGMSKQKDGSAALAGLVAFLVVKTILSPAAVSQLSGVPLEKVNPAFAKIENQFVGILCGIVASVIYNRFNDLQLPEFLAFFSGKRSVPIITSFAMLLVSGILFFIWPSIYSALVTFGISIMKLGAIGAGIYGFFNRLLIPVGLHHTLNSIFWFNVAGINDIGRFWGDPSLAYADVPEIIKSTYIVGMYQAGFFPVMMFGLPAAGYAIYKTAKPEQKKAIGSLMLAAAATSFITGVTEPLEFSFMFAAPMLYFAHAVLSGIFVSLVAMLKTTAGFGFSAGLIDYLLSLRNPNAKNPLLLLAIGLVAAVVYYLVFYTLINVFNLKSPGRSDEDLDTSALDEVLGKVDTKSKFQNDAKIIFNAIGGKENIRSIDNCITRLRLELNDTSKIDKAAIKSTGAKEILVLDPNNVQIIVGTKVQFVADELKKL